MIVDAEFKSLIPPLTEEEYELLEQSIIAEGCRDALVTWNDTLLDGHNRYEICQKHGIDFDTKGIELENRDSAKIWIIDNQRGRRNLTDGWKYELSLKKKDILLEIGKRNKATSGQGIYGGKPLLSESDKSGCVGHDTRKTRADELGWSTGKVAKADYVWKHAPEEIKDEIKSDKKSIDGAYTEIKKEKKKEKREKDIAEQKKLIEEGSAILPQGKYDIIVIDPPWPYGTDYNPSGRRASSPYPEMELEDIEQLDIPSTDDSILFLWTTHNFMRHSFKLLDAWGFREVSIITWVKDRMGLGSWLRSQSEFCIMAVKGKPTVNLTNQTTIVNGPLREHSRKPDEFYEMIDSLCIGRKLDYFSREERPGWASFGNDVGRFNGQ